VAVEIVVVVVFVAVEIVVVVALELVETVDVIDNVLRDDDFNHDGYISYPEYMSARKRDYIKHQQELAHHQDFHRTARLSLLFKLLLLYLWLLKLLLLLYLWLLKLLLLLHWNLLKSGFIRQVTS
jgi:hypothetical protein